MILITWNVQYGKGADGRIDFPRIVETARMLGDADVICFQELAVNFPELDDGAGADQPAIIAGLLPGYTPIFRPALDLGAPGGKRQCFGNMIRGCRCCRSCPICCPGLPRRASAACSASRWRR